jgi:hypothetical protein
MVRCEYSGCGGEPSYGDFKNASKWPCCGKEVNLRLNFPTPEPTPEPVVAPAPAKKKAASKKTKKSKKK